MQGRNCGDVRRIRRIRRRHRHPFDRVRAVGVPAGSQVVRRPPTAGEGDRRGTEIQIRYQGIVRIGDAGNVAPYRVAGPTQTASGVQVPTPSQDRRVATDQSRTRRPALNRRCRRRRYYQRPVRTGRWRRAREATTNNNSRRTRAVRSGSSRGTGTLFCPS